MTKPLPAITADEQEMTFADNESAHYILAFDGTDASSHRVPLNEVDPNRFYRDTGKNDGVAHPYEDDAERTPELTALLESFEKPYLINFLICIQETFSGRYFQLEEAFFESAKDRDAMLAFIGTRMATVKGSTEIVTKTVYTREEADAEKLRIRRLAVENGWSRGTVAAYLAHVSRRTR